MNFLHYEVTTQPGDVIRVQLDSQANVRLLDDTNFYAYRSGRRHTFHGGHAKRSPVDLSPPHAGHWHVVVDLGGYAGNVRASVSVV